MTCSTIKPIPTQNEVKARISLGKDFNNTYLTPREFQVLSHIIHGHTAKEIGQLLAISYRTVEAYIDILKFKLGIKRKREIIKIAIEKGLILKLGIL